MSGEDSEKNKWLATLDEFARLPIADEDKDEWIRSANAVPSTRRNETLPPAYARRLEQLQGGADEEE